MHIGLIGGIGPAATDYYYRGLIRALADSGQQLELTMAHADAPTVLGNLARDDDVAQAALFGDLVARLKTAGAQTVAIPSIAGHFCIDELTKISPLPIINMIDEITRAVSPAVGSSGQKKLGLIGTQKVMETRFYNSLPSIEIVTPPEPEFDLVHQTYVAMATTGTITNTQRQVFFDAGHRLCQDQGAEAVMLGGTDLFLAFDNKEHDNQQYDFQIIDCAAIHIEAIGRIAAA